MLIYDVDKIENLYQEFEKLMAKFPEFVDAVKSCSTKLNNVVSTYKAVDQKVMGL